MAVSHTQGIRVALNDGRKGETRHTKKSKLKGKKYPIYEKRTTKRNV